MPARESENSRDQLAVDLVLEGAALLERPEQRKTSPVCVSSASESTGDMVLPLSSRAHRAHYGLNGPQLQHQLAA